MYRCVQNICAYVEIVDYVFVCVFVCLYVVPDLMAALDNLDESEHLVTGK